jgi:uncharacterized protein with PQ loop repeat
MGEALTTYQALGIFATLYGAAMAAAPFAQAWRLFQRKSSSDVSLPANLLSLSGCGVWVVWGLASQNPPVYIANIVALCSYSSVVALTWLYRA